MIVIVDYGAGNLASIRNMLKKAGFASTISARPEEVLGASKLILPGVGHFDHGMRQLRSSGLEDALNERVLRAGVPVLGICLGLQLLARGSEEGEIPGLGWIDADVRRFDAGRMADNLKVPHMGWADVEQTKPSGLFGTERRDWRFYFVHSYHVVCDRDDDVLVRAHHGYSFVAGIERGNIRGVQFHPEKSHVFGLSLLENFARGA